MQGSMNGTSKNCSPCMPHSFESEFFGAHKRGAYVVFRYFDPFADRVFVVGSFNGWNESVAMEKARDGVFTATVSKDDCPDGTKYKYKVYQDGQARYVSDPYGEKTDGEPYHNSILCKTDGYVWSDGAYLKQCRTVYGGGFKNQPLHLYEMSLTDWCADGAEQVTYESVAWELCSYARQMGYTHVLIDDVFSRYCDESSGARSVAFYAPNTHFGDADGFRRFVDVMHRARVGVIIDWNFDNGRDIYSRYELCQGAVLYWMCNYHIDGIALSVSDKRGADIATNVAFGVQRARRGAVVIVRGEYEASVGDRIVWDTDAGCAVLNEFSTDFDNRRPEISGNTDNKSATDRIVSFGKKRYINAFPGDEWRVFASARAAFAVLIAKGGKKSTYMGCEIGMKDGERVEWNVLEGGYNAGLQLCHSDLGEIYLSHPSLWRNEGLRTVDDSCVRDGVVLLERVLGNERLLILVNTSANAYENRTFTVSEGGTYDEIFNSDSCRYGGSGVVNEKAICIDPNGQKNVMRGIRVPPLAVSIFKLRIK